MKSVAFTNLYLYDGKLESDLVENVSIIIKYEEKGKVQSGRIDWIGPLWLFIKVISLKVHLPKN